MYVFRSNYTEGYPAYDECKLIDSLMSKPINPATGANTPLQFQNAKDAIAIWEKSCVWAGIPMVNPGRSLLETTAKIKLRVDQPYDTLQTTSNFNGGLPLYEFDMTGFEVELGNEYAMDSALLLINVVPNPYFAYSEYETNKLDKISS